MHRLLLQAQHLLQLLQLLLLPAQQALLHQPRLLQLPHHLLLLVKVLLPQVQPALLQVQHYLVVQFLELLQMQRVTY
jgi:hypothetical protein